MKQTPAYDIANDVLLSLVPPNARRIIDVGCMVGAMAREVRTRSPHAEFVGLDIDPNYAAIAAQHCTEAFTCDIENIDPALWDRLFPSDCWIFGDCREHLRDPWLLLRSVRDAIDPDGCLLVCLPNAQHWSVQWRPASSAMKTPVLWTEPTSAGSPAPRCRRCCKAVDGRLKAPSAAIFRPFSSRTASFRRFADWPWPRLRSRSSSARRNTLPVHVQVRTRYPFLDCP
jgi:SAM-dependent methyltransferase